MVTDTGAVSINPGILLTNMNFLSITTTFALMNKAGLPVNTRRMSMNTDPMFGNTGVL